MSGYTLAAVGDIMLDRTIGRRFAEQPHEFELTDVASVLKSHDIVFANLENPVASSGARHPKQDPNVCFRAHPSTLQVLRNLGVNAVSIGNNHLLDYGPDALVETQVHLDRAGIKWAGAGRTYAEANRPLEMDVRGQRVAIFSRCFVHSASTRRATPTRPGVADYRVESLLHDIRAYQSRGYDVHVSVHWGIEYSFYPITYQRRWARQMIDAGARLILGHGPHYPQGFEDYRDGRIVYSLGNFVFDEPMKFTKRSFVFGTRLEPAGLGPTQVHPVHAADGLPHLVVGRPADRMTGLLDAMSRRYRTMSRTEWQRVDNDWFRDMVWRTRTMGSARFFRLAPPSFFLGLGLKNYVKKAIPRRLRELIGGRR